MLFKKILKFTLFILPLFITTILILAQAIELNVAESAIYQAITENNQAQINSLRRLLPHELRQQITEEMRPQLGSLLLEQVKADTVNDKDILPVIDKILRSLTPLHIAAWLGDDQFIQERGLQLENHTHGGYTPLFFAVVGENKSTIQLLMTYSSSQYIHFPIDPKVESEKKDLLMAISNNDIEYIKHYINSGKDIHIRLSGESTLLHFSVRFGSIDTNILLMNSGADVMARDFLGRTPLHLAASDDLYHDVIKLLLKHAADKAEYVNIQDKWGHTPLHKAVTNIQCNNAQLLIKNGAKNLQNRLGRTVLEFAFMHRNEIHRVRRCLGPFLEEFEASSEVVDFRWNKN